MNHKLLNLLKLFLLGLLNSVAWGCGTSQTPQNAITSDSTGLRDTIVFREDSSLFLYFRIGMSYSDAMLMQNAQVEKGLVNKDFTYELNWTGAAQKTDFYSQLLEYRLEYEKNKLASVTLTARAENRINSKYLNSDFPYAHQPGTYGQDKVDGLIKLYSSKYGTPEIIKQSPSEGLQVSTNYSIYVCRNTYIFRDTSKEIRVIVSERYCVSKTYYPFVEEINLYDELGTSNNNIIIVKQLEQIRYVSNISLKEDKLKTDSVLLEKNKKVRQTKSEI